MSYAPSACLRGLASVRSTADALAHESPTLGRMWRELGERKAEAYLKLWLIDLNEALGLKQPLREHQIDQMAVAIVQRYKLLKVADLHLLFTRAKMGELGGIYDRVTMPTVMGWFSKYFDERCEVAASISMDAHVRHKGALSSLPRGHDAERDKYREAWEKIGNEYKRWVLEGMGDGGNGK